MNPFLKQLSMLMGLDTRSNEAMSTGQSGSGAEYLYTQLAPKILETVRQSQFLMGKLPAPVAMPTATYKIPYETTDPVWYVASENANAPTAAGPYTSSKAGTANVTLTSKKNATVIWFSAEEQEDAVIDLEAVLVAKLSKTYARLIDNMLINGDTQTGTTNINANGATYDATNPYSNHIGLIKAAFTASATYDAGTLDTGDFRKLRGLMGERGVDPSDLIACIDLQTYQKMLSLAQLETEEKFGGSATIVKGILTNIDGMEVLPTNIMRLAYTDGKVDGVTAANNTKGRVLLVHKPSVAMGFKRELKLVPVARPENDQFGIVATVRYAQTLPFASGTDENGDAAPSQALAYNITV
jgi:hypothetical protein